jgi:heat shock factor-binding protein 1
LENSDAQGQLTAAVDELLDQLQSKFDNVSKEVFGKCALYLH